MEQIDKYIDWPRQWFALPLVVMLMATGLFFTIRLRFVQVFRFREAIRETIASRQSGASGPLSPLQAFMTSLAATIGTGNIAGVATAIVSGGPGRCSGFGATVSSRWPRSSPRPRWACTFASRTATTCLPGRCTTCAMG